MKIYFCCILMAAALCLQVAARADYHQYNSIDLGTALKMFATGFHHIMPCGYAPLQIPVLAPFHVQHHGFFFNSSYYNIAGNISNYWLTGLDNFQVLGGDFNIAENRLSFDIIFPEIQTLGEYKIDDKASFAGFPIKLLGNGILDNKIKDLRFVGEIVLSSSSQNPADLSVTDFKLHFYVGDVAISNWNNLWDITFNNFINRISSDLALMWFQQLEKRRNDIYDQYLLPSINNKLKYVSMSKLINYLVSQSMEFEMVSCKSL